MLQLKPWAVLSVPSGVKKEWRHVNKEDEDDEFTAFALNEDYFAVGSKHGTVDILNRWLKY